MESAPRPPSASRSLRAVLRRRQTQARIDDAALIRDFRESPERAAEAERCVRETMLAFTLGAITAEERALILEILAFAVPPLPESLADPDRPPWPADSP